MGRRLVRIIFHAGAAASAVALAWMLVAAWRQPREALAQRVAAALKKRVEPSSVGDLDRWRRGELQFPVALVPRPALREPSAVFWVVVIAWLVGWCGWWAYAMWQERRRDPGLCRGVRV